MRVSFNTVQGRTFMIGSTEVAEVDLPDLDPGTYDVVLYDYAQEVDRLLPKVGAFLAKQQAVADAVPKQFRTLGNPARGQALWAQILTLATRDRVRNPPAATDRCRRHRWRPAVRPTAT